MTKVAMHFPELPFIKWVYRREDPGVIYVNLDALEHTNILWILDPEEQVKAEKAAKKRKETIK